MNLSATAKYLRKNPVSGQPRIESIEETGFLSNLLFTEVFSQKPGF